MLLAKYTCTNTRAQNTDLEYADDITLLASQLSDLETCLSVFEVTAARPIGLNVSWPKTNVLRRIGNVASSISSLPRIWRQERLSIHAKFQVYMTSIASVLLYGSESWILLASDIRRLEALHRPMRCQRQILCVRWQDRPMVKNRPIAEKTGLPSVSAVVDARRAALFGHE